MAQLKDLIVNGASRLIGDTYVNKIQISAVDAPTSSGGTTYGPGSSGQVLKTNGTSIYWDSAGGTGTVTQVTAGTGLKVGSASSGGDITTTGTINHINSVTAQTTQAVYPIKIDAQGHISAYGSAVSIPSAATATPVVDGTAAVGSSSKYAKEDHVHPTDTSRAATTTVATQASINSSGLITYKNSSGTSLFTLQLPLYNGGVS